MIVSFTDGSTLIDIDMVFILAADYHIIHPVIPDNPSPFYTTQSRKWL